MMEQNIEKASIINQKIKQLKDKKDQRRIQQLYQQVIQKNFQTIDDLLKKLTYIISRQDEIEYQFQSMIKKLMKFQTDLESIHNQHRRDNLHIISNLSGIKTQIDGIDTHIKLLLRDRFKGVGGLGGNGKWQDQCSDGKDGMGGRDGRDGKERIGGGLSSSGKISDGYGFVNKVLGQQSSDDKQNKKNNIQQMKNYQPMTTPYLTHYDSSDHIESTKIIVPQIKKSKLKNFKKSMKIVGEQKNQFQLSQESKKQQNYKENQQNRVQNIDCNSKEQKIIQNYQDDENNFILAYLNQIINPQDTNSLQEEKAKAEIVASFAKHQKKLSDLFIQAREKGTTPAQIKQTFFNAIDEIIQQDPELRQQIFKNKQIKRVSKQISEILYEKIFVEQLNFQQVMMPSKQIQEKARQQAAKEVQQLKIKFQNFVQNFTKFEGQFEANQQEIIEIGKQMKIIKEQEKKFVTYEEMMNQTFKVLEKSHSKWSDFYTYFASKDEMKKAFAFIMSKIGKNRDASTIISQNQDVEVSYSNIETKCICCTRYLNKNSYNTTTQRSTSKVQRNSCTSVSQKIKSSILKKKTLEVLKNVQVKLGSKSIDIS